MEEFTLGKSLMNVNSVANVLVKQEASGFMKEFVKNTLVQFEFDVYFSIH